ncbi:hypothetical protein L7F22_018358 [Adiantum nelumboides]|nr:hypothetical protein [Adiantum nelumboides]
MESVYAASKEKDREREKEKEKEKDKEREREVEMEAALYTNCLLLGLDASVLGQGGMPRSGLFRHSNPRMGENLLHFLLSALRGPAQSAKDFAGVWPIFDAGQSRDFRKIVQNLINELEAQGALPRSNSRVSSLATCCGQRFVELLWQLSAHALREVHKRSFPADVLSNPLPSSLTEIVAQSNNASALLTVTKARIAIERRRFLDGAAAAVRRQALWSSLAHDMTAEYRALCAEEAYLHQELEKLQEPRHQREGVIREGLNITEGSFEAQKSLSVSKASQLWESLISHTAQHEKLASGPIEDLIAHREHRYRVSGPALRAAMDRSSIVSSNELPSFTSEDEGPPNATVQNDQAILSYSNLNHARLDIAVNALELNEESRARIDERNAKGSSPIDVAEILRRWTHSLQRLHKQALRLFLPRLRLFGSMVASAPILGTTQDAPRPGTWTYELTEQDEMEMQTAIEHFSGRTKFVRRGIAARMVELDAAIPDDWQQVLTGHRDMPLHVGWWASFDRQAGHSLRDMVRSFME